MGALVLGAAAASVFFVLGVSLEAYLALRVLRALDLGGPKATFRRAVVVFLCMVPFGVALGAFAHFVAEARGFGELGELGLSVALGAPLHLVAFRKGFDLAPADALVALVVFYLSGLGLGLLLSLALGFALAHPPIAIGLGLLAGLYRWVGQSRREALLKRLGAET